MEITDSSTQKNELFCLVRKIWVAAQPEEKVRQKLLSHLIERLRFPHSSLAVEKALDQMPHLPLDGKSIPERRADIISFAKGIHPNHDLYPLLMIECKAVPLVDDTLLQVIGYNQHIKSCFIAIANAEEIRMGWYDVHKKDYTFIPYIPPYEQLLRSIQIK